MDKIRIGVVGLRFGQHHLRTLANMDEADLVAVADRSPKMPGGLEAYAGQYGARAYRDGVEMIEGADLDAVSIATPARFLALQEKIGSAALRANVDVTSLYDFWDMWAPAKKVEQVCSGLAGHYGLGHIKEVALAEGFHIHIGLAPLGDGPTDWAQVLRLMQPHLPQDSWLILEHAQTPDEARSSLAHLRAAAAQAGVELQ